MVVAGGHTHVHGSMHVVRRHPMVVAGTCTGLGLGGTVGVRLGLGLGLGSGMMALVYETVRVRVRDRVGDDGTRV